MAISSTDHSFLIRSHRRGRSAAATGRFTMTGRPLCLMYWPMYRIDILTPNVWEMSDVCHTGDRMAPDQAATATPHPVTAGIVDHVP